MVTYLGRTRWFGGKGRPFEVTGDPTDRRDPTRRRRAAGRHPAGGGDVRRRRGRHRVLPGAPRPLHRPRDPARPRLHRLVGGARVRLGARLRRAPRPRGDGQLAARLRPRRPARPAATGTTRRPAWPSTDCPGTTSTSSVHSTLFSGEQSNSSVAFGDDSLMKVFRKITPGVNPDIRVHDVLTRAGSDNIASLFGWLDWIDREEGEEAGGTGTTVQLAMLQQFLRTASDGWDLALASARNLFAEADLHAHEAGGDFAGEASRLGEALRDVHTVLAEHFPVEVRDAGATGGARRRDDRPARGGAARSYPSSRRTPTRCVRSTTGSAAWTASRSSRSTATCTSARPSRTSLGWKIVDFEGEPAKPLAERLLPGLAVARRRRDAALLRLRAARRVAGAGRARPERRAAAGLPHRRVGAPQPQPLPGRLRRRRDRPRAADPAGRLRRRQGRLRDRLRDPQPSDLGGHPTRGRGKDRSQHEHPGPPPEADRQPPSSADRVRRARPPARRARRPPARRRRDGAGAASRWPRASRCATATAPNRGGSSCIHEHEGIWAGVLPVAEVPDYRVAIDYAGHEIVRRRPLPLPADARRGRPAPDQRGPPRAALAGPRRPRPPLRHAPGRRGLRHLLRGLGAVGARRPAARRLQQLGRPRAPDAAARQLRRLGALRARRRLRHRVQVRRPRRRRAVARQGRPDGVVGREARRHRVEGVRVRLHRGATTTGSPGAPSGSRSPAR